MVSTPRTLLKVQKNKNITLPVSAMKRYHLATGDYLQVQETPAGLLLKPMKLVDASQAYFWTKEWQEGEREADEDIRAGRVKKFKNIKDLVRDLRS